MGAAMITLSGPPVTRSARQPDPPGRVLSTSTGSDVTERPPSATLGDRPGSADQPPPGSSPRWRRWLRSAWNAVVAAIGAAVGLAPHLLHHVGLVAGAGFLAGAAGTAIFGVVGLVASVPFLLRLKHRFATWKAPLIALALFAVTFSLSSFVIGPRLTSGDAPAPANPSGVTSPVDPGHSSHPSHTSP